MGDDDGQNIVAGKIRQQLMVKTPDYFKSNSIVEVKTIEEAQALVGTTWEGKGGQRTIVRAGDLYIVWTRPVGSRRPIGAMYQTFFRWLKTAKRVDNASPGV
jgi:hypothetical protein